MKFEFPLKIELESVNCTLKGCTRYRSYLVHFLEIKANHHTIKVFVVINLKISKFPEICNLVYIFIYGKKYSLFFGKRIFINLLLYGSDYLILS